MWERSVAALRDWESASLAFPPAEAKWLSDRLAVQPFREPDSWLKSTEVGPKALGSRCLDRRSPDRPTLAAGVAASAADRHAAIFTVDWSITTIDARIKSKRLVSVL